MKFTITSSVPSINKQTGQQYVDNYGNRSFSVVLKDEQGGIASILKRVKQGNPDPKVGDILIGTLETKYSQTGNSYTVFVAEQKAFGNQGFKTSDPNTMLIAYAKDIVVALINNAEKGKLTSESIKDDLSTLTYYLKGLYDELKADKSQTIAPSNPPQPTGNTGQITDEELNQVFPQGEE